MNALGTVDELLGRPVSLRALALLRVLAGPLVVIHLWPFLVDARHGHIYSDAFYEPYVSWYPELPRFLYVAMLWAGVGAAVTLAVGLFTRVASAATLGIVTYNLFLSTTHLHSNRAFLVIVLCGLALTPCGREVSVDAWRRAHQGLPALDPSGPAWPLWLLRFEAAVVYSASGLSKLVDPDWFGGTVTWHRMVQVQDRLADSALPGWVVTVLTNRSFHTYAAKVIVLTELSIAMGLWWRRTRYAAVWVAVCFHVAIQLSASVQVFSYLAIATLVIWAVPSTRDRVLVVDPTARWQRRLSTMVGRLDWLARFRVVTGPPGTELAVIDRDGAVIEGAAAAAFALSRLPLTAWLALPSLLLPPFRQTRHARPPVMATSPAGP